MKVSLLFSAIWATVAAISAGVSEFFQKHIIVAPDFYTLALIMLTLDTISGVWKSWKRHEFSSYAFGGVMTKFLLYFLVVTAIQTGAKAMPTDFMRDWLINFGQSWIVFKELMSLTENIAVIYPKMVPKFVRKSLSEFDETGEIKPRPAQ